jgi:hypothetical protein
VPRAAGARTHTPSNRGWTRRCTRWGAAAPYDASSLSVLSRFATHGRLVLKPYPYIVINDALPPDLYRALEASFLTDR